MNNSLKTLQEKYAGKQRPAGVGVVDRCEFVPGAAGWRGCAAVCSLQEYIAGHPKLGAQVGLDGEDKSRLVVRFRPPLDCNDLDRMELARTTISLAAAAKADILRLVGSGGMRVRIFDSH